MDRRFVLTLDVDMQGEVSPDDQQIVLADVPGLRIEVLEQEAGHGFGLGEVVNLGVMIGSGVASDVAAGYVRSGVKAVIRRVKGSKGESDGTEKSIAQLIEREREGSDGDEGGQAHSDSEG